MGRAIGEIRAVPGVRAAALVGSEPLSGNYGRVTYQVEGQPEQSVPPAAQANVISDGFFRTMEIPLLQGRDFNEADRAETTPVVIVNEEFARHAWPGAAALGRRLKIIGPPDVWATVVGVVGGIKQRSLADPPMPQLYQPVSQSPGIFTAIEVRTVGDPAAYANSVRAAVWAVDPDQPVWRVTPVQAFVEGNIAAPRFTLLLTGAFALMSLILAVIGVYGVMAYVLVQRTRELGVRVALGARSSQVVGTVLAHGATVVTVAALAGLAIAFAGARLLRAQLFGVTPNDPLTFAVVPVLLSAVAILACYLPARRAARVDPVAALRAE
jgi:putative ABC transport system permease protein